MRRSKIYYLSELKGKSARIREKRPAGGKSGGRKAKSAARAASAPVVPETAEAPEPATEA